MRFSYSLPIKERKLEIRAEFIKSKNRYATQAIFDTGSTVTIIPPEIADYLEFETDRGQPKMTIVTGSGSLEVPRKIADILRIKEMAFRNVIVGVHKIPDPIKIKVLIGMNVIEQIKLIIDGKHRKFEIQNR